jgi:uncharacterized iron-regulated protein
MIRFSAFVYPAAALCLFAMTACAPVGKQVMGDPQEPYPLAAPPRIGQIVHLPTGTPVSQAQMLAVARDARIVYVGETHDNPASHRLELQVLEALAERYPGRVALGMEMFVRSQQPTLDLWIAGKLDEKAFLKESHWFDIWNMDFAYYRDLLNFARSRHIPVIALDAEKSLVKAVRSKALEQLSPAERAQLPQLDQADPYERGLVAAIFGGHIHGGMQIDNFVRAQIVRDETMAESAARYLASSAGEDKHLLVIAGGDHVSSGFGIPRRVFRRFAASYTIIGGKEVDIQPDKKDRIMDVDIPDFPMVPYDFQVYQAYEDLPETGVRLGVMIEAAPAGHGLVVKGVLPGSNAERAGLLLGDLLISLDGESLRDIFDLTYAVQQKHPGDRGVLQVERLGKTLKLEVVFLAAQKDHQHGKK